MELRVVSDGYLLDWPVVRERVAIIKVVLRANMRRLYTVPQSELNGVQTIRYVPLDLVKKTGKVA